jgi:acyltransferase
VGKDVIYAFHVPAFLLITGFLLPADFGRMPAMTVLRRWILLYIRVYAFFSVIAIAIWWAVAVAGERGPVDPWPAIGGALYGVAGSGNGLVHHNQPLWYFPFLVTSLLGAWICAGLSDRIPPLSGWGVALAYAAFAMIYAGPRLPWDIDIAGLGVLMVLAGRMLRQHSARLEPWIETPRRAIPLAVLFGALLIGISALNGATNLNGAQFGASGVLFVAGALAGSGAVLLLAAQLPPTALARTISTQTLTIFALHFYLVRAAGGLPVPQSPLLQQIVMWVLAALIVLACLPIARALQPVLDRWVMRRPVSPATVPVA